MSIEDIYNKYYSKIDKEDFDTLIAVDPTTKPNKMGIYCKWLLKIYKEGKGDWEDYYKATEYLRLYDRFKHLLPVEQRDINNIEDLPDLAMVIEPFEEQRPEFLSSAENKKAAFVESFKKYDLYIPTTYEQSRDLGRGSKWCTAADSEDAKQTFKNYFSKGKLYIFISKTDPKQKYQFHFEERQFMDRYDKHIVLETFLDKNPDIKEYFKPQIEKMLEYLKFENYEIITKPQFPDVTFFCLNGELLMEWDKFRLWVYHSKIWSVFQNYYGYDDSKINYIISVKMNKSYFMIKNKLRKIKDPSRTPPSGLFNWNRIYTTNQVRPIIF